jgi:predicted DNA-binding antitoxin AbrB/MazE fold protein
MVQTTWAVIRGGKIELLEPVMLPEGARVLVTLIAEEDEQNFWLAASERSLAKVWENNEDDVYAALLPT